MMTPAGQVQYLNPDALNKNPAFTNVIVVTGSVKTVYIGGQDAVDASGAIIGKGDLKAQTAQVLKNIQLALSAGGARVEHVDCDTRSDRRRRVPCRRTDRDGPSATSWRVGQ